MTSPVLATNGPGGRWYQIPDPIIPGGFRGPSVTTILSNGIPAPARKAWGERLVATYAVEHVDAWRKLPRQDAIDHVRRAPYRQLNEAGNRGTDIHTIAQRILDGIDPNSWEGQTYGKYAHYISDFLADYDVNVLGYERTVVNTEANYAGSYDLLCRIGDETWLIDWKTSKAVYGKFALQLAAYANATHEIVSNTAVPMPQVDRLGIVHLTEYGYQLYPVEASIEDCFCVFISACDIANFTTIEERHTIGQPLATIPTADIREDLITQMRELGERHPEALTEIAERWPGIIPTLRTPGHTRKQLYILAALVNDVERKYPDLTERYAHHYERKAAAERIDRLTVHQRKAIIGYAETAGIPQIDKNSMTLKQLETLQQIIDIVQLIPNTKERTAIIKRTSAGRTQHPAELDPTEIAAILATTPNPTQPEQENTP
jgi:hypothetical protein